MTERGFFSRTGLALWAGAIIGAACVLPYTLALLSFQGAESSHVAIPRVVALSMVQSTVLLGVMTFAGLWAARRLGMGAPTVDAWVHGRPLPSSVGRQVLVSVVLGVSIGLALLALDLWLCARLSPEGVGRLLRERQPPAWMGLLASVEGGLTEEVELRLFLLSFLALGLRRVTRRSAELDAPSVSSAVFWTANAVAAVLFGLGHLPITSRLVALTPAVVARAVVQNGSLGLITGQLFRRRGIEMAMVCHFCADLVLHVAAPLAQDWLLRAAPLAATG